MKEITFFKKEGEELNYGYSDEGVATEENLEAEIIRKHLVNDETMKIIEKMLEIREYYIRKEYDDSDNPLIDIAF